MNDLAFQLRVKGNFETAERIYRAVLKVRKRELRTKHPKTFVSTINLANLLEAKGENTAAADLYRRVIPKAERALSQNLIKSTEQSQRSYKRNIKGLLKKMKRSLEHLEEKMNQTKADSARESP